MYGLNLSPKSPGKYPNVLPTSIVARVTNKCEICFFNRNSRPACAPTNDLPEPALPVIITI